MLQLYNHHMWLASSGGQQAQSMYHMQRWSIAVGYLSTKAANIPDSTRAAMAADPWS
jgi:hypothetical protein